MRFITVQVPVVKPSGRKSYQPMTVLPRHKREGRVRSFTLQGGIAAKRRVRSA